MKKFNWFWTLILCFTISILGFVSISGTASAAPASKNPMTTANWQTIVSKANPYVHIIHRTASVDPQMRNVLTKDEMTYVSQSIINFNTSSLTLRQHPHGSFSLTSESALQPHSNAYKWTYDVYWWGVRIWINTYAAQNFNNFMIVAGGALGAAVGSVLGATAGAVIGALVGTITGVAISFVDNECGQQGVYIDINFALQVSLNSVC